MIFALAESSEIADRGTHDWKSMGTAEESLWATEVLQWSITVFFNVPCQ